MTIHHRLQPLIRKFDAIAALSASDRAAVQALPYTLKTATPSTYLMREGEPTASCSILLTGLAYRQKLAGDGGRAILSLHLPGDVLDLQNLFVDVADHNVQMLTHGELAVVPRAAMLALLDQCPALARAVTIDLSLDASIQREWLLNIGRRGARPRLAHLLCEVAARLDARRLGSGDGYSLPMTQEQLGDALGLTSVHVNRTIKSLELDGLIRRAGQLFHILDLPGLRTVGDYGGLYLHQG